MLEKHLNIAAVTTAEKSKGPKAERRRCLQNERELLRSK